MVHVATPHSNRVYNSVILNKSPPLSPLCIVMLGQSGAQRLCSGAAPRSEIRARCTRLRGKCVATGCCLAVLIAAVFYLVCLQPWWHECVNESQSCGFSRDSNPVSASGFTFSTVEPPQTAGVTDNPRPPPLRHRSQNNVGRLLGENPHHSIRPPLQRCAGTRSCLPYS